MVQVAEANCRNEYSVSDEKFMEAFRATVLDEVTPEIRSAVFDATRETNTSVRSILRAPDQTRALEIASVVEKRLQPVLSAFTRALHRLAVATELHTNTPEGSALGSVETRVMSSHMQLEQIKFSLESLTLEVAQSRQNNEKFVLTMLHAIDRDMKIEDDLELKLKSHFKRLKTMAISFMHAKESLKNADPIQVFDHIAHFMEEYLQVQTEFESFFIIPADKTPIADESATNNDKAPAEETQSAIERTSNEEVSASATWQSASRHVYGHPEDERGQDDASLLPSCPESPTG